MTRRKAIYHGRWTGETVSMGDDLMLFLILDEDPDRLVMLTITPTLAKRLLRKLEHGGGYAGYD